MKVFALGIGGVALVLALLMTAIAPPASASSICQRFHADAAEGHAMANEMWFARGVFADYYDKSHKLVTVMTEDYLCERNKRGFPLLIDERRLLDLDPHKCGLTDNGLWMIDHAIELTVNLDCIQNDPALKKLASKYLRKN